MVKSLLVGLKVFVVVEVAEAADVAVDAVAAAEEHAAVVSPPTLQIRLQMRLGADRQSPVHCLPGHHMAMAGVQSWIEVEVEEGEDLDCSVPESCFQSWEPVQGEGQEEAAVLVVPDFAKVLVVLDPG